MSNIPANKKDQILSQVENFLNSRDLKTLTASELEYITKQLLVDQLKDELKTEIKMSKTDLDSLQDRWLSGFDSYATRETYGKSLQIFFDWLELKSLNVFKLNSIDIDDYVNYIYKQYDMNNSIRERIAAVSSFFSFLERNDIISKNYFKGCRRPPRPFETKESDDIPDEEQLLLIEEKLKEELRAKGKGSAGKQRQARALLAVVAVMKYHAIRCGALPSLTIDKTGRYRAESKGREIKGQLEPRAAATLKTLGFNQVKPFKDMKVNSIQKGFERFNKRLYAAGEIRAVYSLHDLRHFAAVKHYENGKDIIATQRFLGHSSVAITQGYLAGLDCD